MSAEFARRGGWWKWEQIAGLLERDRMAVRWQILADRHAYLDSPNLDPAWIAGWHSATDHHASRIARSEAS